MGIRVKRMAHVLLFYFDEGVKRWNTAHRLGFRRQTPAGQRQRGRKTRARCRLSVIRVLASWKNKSSSPPVDAEQETKNATSRLHTDRDSSQYFSLASLFFSEIATENALDIDLLDTMFFQPDHSICYLYKDARKGLIRIKQRGINACETFLKRKVKKRENISSK